MSPTNKKNKKARQAGKALDEQLQQVRNDIKSAEDKLQTMPECPEVNDLAQVLKSVLRSMDKAMASSHDFYRNLEKRDGQLRNRIVKFWNDYDLPGYGYAYDQDIDPVDNLVLFIKHGYPEMRDGRAYAKTIRAALATNNDGLIAKAARRIDKLQEGPIPESVLEEAMNELESILHDLTVSCSGDHMCEDHDVQPDDQPDIKPSE